MGLDTSHDAWHGAYSAFTRWRNRIARAGGYMLSEIKAFNGIPGHEYPLLDYGHLTEAQCLGKWERTPEDPLLVLLWHSDCEGEIYPEQAGPLADRLESLLPALGAEEGGGHVGSYADKTRTFIAGLRAAAAAGEPIVFH